MSWTLVVPRLCLSWAPSLGWVDKCSVSSKGISSHNSIYTQKADSLIYQVCHASQGHTMFKMTLDPKSFSDNHSPFPTPCFRLHIYARVSCALKQNRTSFQKTFLFCIFIFPLSVADSFCCIYFLLYFKGLERKIDSY